MNMQVTKEVECKNAKGETTEKIVETVDYRTSAGKPQEKRTVQVIHHPNPNTKQDFATSGGVLAGAAAAVANTLQSAQEAISRK